MLMIDKFFMHWYFDGSGCCGKERKVRAFIYDGVCESSTSSRTSAAEHLYDM